MPLPKWLMILKSVGPLIIATTVPGGALLAPIIVGAIEAAEKLPTATGPAKKQAAMELIAAGIAGANAVAKKTVVDPAAGAAVADHAIETVVGVINLLDRDEPPAVEPIVPDPH